MIQFLCEVVRVLLLVVHAVYCTIVRPLISFFLDAINALVSAIEVLLCVCVCLRVCVCRAECDAARTS